MRLPYFWLRLWAMIVKETIQMRRDRLSFAMMVGIPIVQLTLFGFAINTDPRHLPTAIMDGDPGPFSRSLVRSLENSGYFRIIDPNIDEKRAESWMQTGEVQFIVRIPEDFSRRLQRGERPAILIEADASDPVAAGNALTALASLNNGVLDRELQGALDWLKNRPPPFELRVHRRYNPEGISQYHIIPGLLGVILTMTMILMTGLAITRERERGTMENLLATPVRPLEVMIGKLIPYIAVGYVQVTLILIAARVIFAVPIQGSIVLLFGCALPFIAANLAMGILFSTIARNQLQAMQMTMFFFLPSILLSGFMFPFRGMPEWAQYLGSILPLTHFLRLVRGIILKGNAWPETLPHLWPIFFFIFVVIFLGLQRYRRTLD